MYKSLLSKITSVAAISSLLILAGCNSTATATDTMLKGVSFSPRSSTLGDFTDFFTLAAATGDIVTWQGDWQELADVNAAPSVVTQFGKTYKFDTVVVLQAFDNSSGAAIHPLDDKTVQGYMDSLQAYVTTYKPKFLGIGIEVNLLNDKSPASFQQQVNLFNRADAVIKAASPNTRVFTTFQLEHMKGLQGGLFGGDNNSEPQWALLDSFAKADLIAFTTYPGLIYDNPSLIPSTYFEDIPSHTSKPYAISETGWFRVAPEGWSESSDSEQGAYIAQLPDLLPVPRPQFLIWSFMYDPAVLNPLFNTMGLLTGDAQTSPAWVAWQDLK